MATTFYDLHSQLRAEIGDYFPVNLAKLYTQRAMREVSERHAWSWLYSLGEIVVPAAITGQVTVVEGAMTVVVDATLIAAINALTGPPIGRRQIRIGTTGGAIFEIRAWDGVDTLTLNFPVPLTSGTYTANIVKAYYLPPNVEQGLGVDPIESTNFKCYVTVRDKTNNFPLVLEHSARWIDKRDPRRDSTGTPTHFLQMAPTTSRFPGAGNSPGQIPPGAMRHELWPHPTGTYTYDCLYRMREWPLADDRVSTLPENLNSELVLSTALVKAYRWALGQRGLSTRSSVQAYAAMMANAAQERDRLFLEAYREDQLYFDGRMKDLIGGKFPWVMGAAYAQVHDVYLMSGLFTE